MLTRDSRNAAVFLQRPPAFQFCPKGPGSRTEIVMLKPPDAGTRLELSSFVRPDSVPASPAAMANELGLRIGAPQGR